MKASIALAVAVLMLLCCGTKAGSFINSLGMKFVPVPGTDVLFSVWLTRLKDYRAYAETDSCPEELRPAPDTGTMWPAKGYVWSTPGWQKPGYEQDENHPVAQVSWEHAMAFCRWLTAKERADGIIGDDQEYRLPRDREWNAAVGSGNYPWGNQWPPPEGAGNYGPGLNVDRYAATSPCGSFRPNEFGLFDMGGNLLQWCEDWYRAEMNDREVLRVFDELGDDGGGRKYRVLRGASWTAEIPEYLRSSVRVYGGFPDKQSAHNGFRCVLTRGSAR